MTFERPMSRRGLLKTWFEGKKKGKVSGNRCPAGHTTRQPSKIPRETSYVQRDIRKGCSPVERCEGKKREGLRQQMSSGTYN